MVNHNNLGKNILELVKVFPELVGSYNSLVFYYWTIFDNVSHISDVKKATSPESINRAYRKLIENNLIKVSEKEKRAVVEKVYSNDFAGL